MKVSNPHITRLKTALGLTCIVLLLSACNRPPESTVLTPAQENLLDKANNMDVQLQQQADERAEQMRAQGY